MGMLLLAMMAAAGFAAAPEFPPDVMEALRERTANMALGPLFWTPTVEGLYNFPYTVRNHEFIDNDSWHRGLPPEIVADIRKSLEHPDKTSCISGASCSSSACLPCCTCANAVCGCG